MMDEFDNLLNSMLMETFSSITKVEEGALKSTGKTDLTINEMHLLEAVGKFKDKGGTIGDLAQSMNITMPSVTVAINKLVKKGYVNKNRCQSDGRVVYVTLTKLGVKIDKVHRYFHEQLIRSVSKSINKDEKAVLLRGIGEINNFFQKKAKDMGV